MPHYRRTIVCGGTMERTETTQVSGSYVARHWRGEMSLARSFWLNCILLSLAFCLIYLAPLDFYMTRWPKLIAGGLVALYVFSIPLGVWQCVGTWRSARVRAAGGRPFWARVAQVVIGLDVLASAYSVVVIMLSQSIDLAQVAIGRDPYGRFQVSVSEDGRNLVVDGGIGFGLSEAVIDALDRHREVTTVELWSPGGRIVEARSLAEIVERRGLNTLVIDSCASACTLVFIAGKERELASDARLGFHNGTIIGASEVEANAWQMVDREYLWRRGISADFVTRIYATPFTSVWEPSHAELLRAKVATGHAIVSN
jgi:hypothetical protein